MTYMKKINSKSQKNRKKLNTRNEDNSTSCIKTFVDSPSTTRAGTRYSAKSLVNSKNTLSQDNGMYVFGCILSETALSSVKLSFKARSVSRKVKILCMCKNCMNPNALKECVKNKSGVVCIQVKQCSMCHRQLRSTGSQSVINHESLKLSCTFRKPIKVKRPIVEKDQKNFKFHCLNSDKTFQPIKQCAESYEFEAKQKKVWEKNYHLIKTSETSNHKPFKRRHRKSRSKSLLKHVLKKEALKSYQMKKWSFYKKRIKKLHFQIKHMPKFPKKILALSKLNTQTSRNKTCGIFNIKKLRNEEVIPSPEHNKNLSLCKSKSHLLWKINKSNSIKKLVNNSSKNKIKLKKLGQFSIKKNILLSKPIKLQLNVTSLNLPMRYSYTRDHVKLLDKLQSFCSNLLPKNKKYLTSSGVSRLFLQ